MKTQSLEKALDRLNEIVRIVFRGRYVGIAVAGIIDRIHGETLRQIGDDLLEEVELRPQRVQKNQRRAFARFDVAKADAVDTDILDLDVRRPGEALRGFP